MTVPIAPFLIMVVAFLIAMAVIGQLQKDRDFWKTLSAKWEATNANSMLAAQMWEAVAKARAKTIAELEGRKHDV